jgi:hypothetical protein
VFRRQHDIRGGRLESAEFEGLRHRPAPPPGAVKRSLAFIYVNRFSTALLYGRAGRLTTKNGGSRPGQHPRTLSTVRILHSYVQSVWGIRCMHFQPSGACRNRKTTLNSVFLRFLHGPCVPTEYSSELLGIPIENRLTRHAGRLAQGEPVIK